MKKPKLRYRLEQWGNWAVFQVLYMDERFRGEGRYYNLGLYVEAAPGGASLRPNGVDLGTCSPQRLSTVDLGSVEDAASYITKVHAALADWAENWDGWQDDATPEPVANGPRIWEV